MSIEVQPRRTIGAEFLRVHVGSSCHISLAAVTALDNLLAVPRALVLGLGAVLVLGSAVNGL
jgi:hypothetical protein